MVHYNQLRGLLLFCWQGQYTFLPQGGLLIWVLAELLCTVLNIGLVYKCMFRTHSIHHDANSLSLGEYELLSHTHTHTAQPFPTVYQNITLYFTISSPHTHLSVLKIHIHGHTQWITPTTRQTCQDMFGFLFIYLGVITTICTAY